MNGSSQTKPKMAAMNSKWPTKDNMAIDMSTKFNTVDSWLV